MSNVKVKIDTTQLVNIVQGANKRFFRRAGALLMTIARRSIKKTAYVKKGETMASPEGKPPYYHGATFGGGLTFRRSILFSADDYGVVIGPVEGKSGALGEFHEFGGMMWRKRNRKEYSIGKAGPIRETVSYAKSGKTFSSGVFAPLMTDRQVQRARQLDLKLYPGSQVRIEYKKRPFMQPALQTAEPKLLEIWNECIK